MSIPILGSYVQPCQPLINENLETHEKKSVFSPSGLNKANPSSILEELTVNLCISLC